MIILQKEQIILLKEHINEIIILLEKYDALYTAQFRPTLTMMVRNIEQCINNQFEGIEELSKYIFEDWRIACVGNYGMDNWYLDLQDLICKQEVNKEIQKRVLYIEHTLKTNYIIPKKWYSYKELQDVGVRFKEREDFWESIIGKLKLKKKYYKSDIEYVPDDIWSYAKMLFSDTDNNIKKWFQENIPAYGYLSPAHILKLDGGSEILRSFMLDIPF